MTTALPAVARLLDPVSADNDRVRHETDALRKMLSAAETADAHNRPELAHEIRQLARRAFPGGVL